MWESPADTADSDEEYLVMEHCQENLSVLLGNDYLLQPKQNNLLVCLLVPWSGVPRHWVVGMERKGEFTAFLSM